MAAKYTDSVLRGIQYTEQSEMPNFSTLSPLRLGSDLILLYGMPGNDLRSDISSLFILKDLEHQEDIASEFIHFCTPSHKFVEPVNRSGVHIII